jgi:short-subunit dehydrogenase
MDIKNKRIVVTGAASGIGKALVTNLSQYDCHILAVDRNSDGLSQFLEQVLNAKAKIHSYICDIGYQEQIDNLFDHARQELGDIDIFIANAGYAYYEQLSNADWDRIDQIFKVNVHSPIYTAIKMKQLHPDSTYKMVVTASAIGKLGLPGYALYGATKSAIDRFAEAYRFELPDPSSLALVYPIATRTQFFQEASDHKAPTPWPSQTPQQVASAIIRGIEKDHKSINPSLVYQIFLGVGRIIPPLYRLEQWIEMQRFKKWIKARAE